VAAQLRVAVGVTVGVVQAGVAASILAVLDVGVRVAWIYPVSGWEMESR
jgi:hypothetical protein